MMKFITLFSVALFGVACTGGGSTSRVQPGTGTATSATSTDPASASLTFQVDTNKVDSNSVTAFLVGSIDKYKMAGLGPNGFGFSDVPDGSYDLIVTGSAVAVAGAAATELGNRYNAIALAKGKPVNRGVLALGKRGDITGIAKLASGGSPEGILIEIPGTPYSAKADAQGNFAFDSIPVGDHSLKYSFEGAADQTVPSVIVTDGESKAVATVTLSIAGTSPSSPSPSSPTPSNPSPGPAPSPNPPPGTLSGGSITIGGGGIYTTSDTVTVALTAPTGATKFKISETATVPGEFLPLAASTTYTFTSDGAKTLYVLFSNDTAQSAVVSASINVDTVPPTAVTVSVGGGTNLTNLVTPVLAIHATSGLYMRFALSSAALDAAAWFNYGSTYTGLSLDGTQPDGVRQVWYQFKDAAGNATTSAFTPVTLVRTGPSMTSMVITGGLTLTKFGTLPLSIVPNAAAFSAPTGFEYSCDATTYRLLTYAAALTVDTVDSSAGCVTSDGAKTITARLVDVFGNKGPTSFVNFTFDTTPPVLPVLDPMALYTNLATITVSGTTDAGAAINITGGSAVANTTANGAGVFSVSVSLTANAANDLVVKATDAATNFSTTPVTVTRDSIAPVISAITVELTSETALIKWTTNEPADSAIDYGTTTAYGLTVTDSTPVTNHSLTIIALANDTTFHFKVKSADRATNLAQSADDNFRTFLDASSSITTNTTWSSLTTSYYVSGNFRINPGITLTIKPGVKVVAAPGTVVLVEGTLVARGTPASRITFTSMKVPPSPGDWDSIAFPSDCTGATFDGSYNYLNKSILENVDIEYAGTTTASVVGQGCSLAIFNSTIKRSGSAGVSWDAGTAPSSGTLVVRDSTVSNNVGNGFSLINTDVTAVSHYELSNNRITANGAWGIKSTKGMAQTYNQNVIAGNGSGGIFAGDNAMTANNNVIASNGVGVKFAYEGDAAGAGSYSMANDALVLNSAGQGVAIQDANDVAQSQTITLTNSLVFGNIAAGLGAGAISTSQGTASGIVPYTGTKLNFTSSNVFGNSSTYAMTATVKNNLAATDVTATYDWWGSSTDLSIQAKIYDFTKNSADNLVNYRPFRVGANTLVPIAPPTSLAVASTVTGQAQLSWKLNSESDWSGNYIYYGLQSGYPYTGVGAVEGSSRVDAEADPVTCSVNAGTSTRTCTLTGLTSGSDYFFSVTSYDDGSDVAAYALDQALDIDTTTSFLRFPGHGFANGQRGVLSVSTGGALPAAFNQATNYFVVNSQPDSFQLAATSGGAFIAVPAKGSLTLKFNPNQVAILATAVNTGTGAVTAASHGLLDGQRGRFSVPGGGTMPTGLTAGTNYFIKYVDANTFKLATTYGGATVAITGAGSGNMVFTPNQPLGAGRLPPLSFNTTTSVSSGVFTSAAYPLPNQQRGRLTPLDAVSQLPAGLLQANDYFLQPIDANTFKLSAARGGAVVTYVPNFTFTPSAIAIGTGTFSYSQNALENGTKGRFTTTGVLPTGLAAATDYFVVQRSENSFKVAATKGGAALTFSAAATGTTTFTPQAPNGEGTVIFTPTQPTASGVDYQLTGHESWYGKEVTIKVK